MFFQTNITWFSLWRNQGRHITCWWMQEFSTSVTVTTSRNDLWCSTMVTLAVRYLGKQREFEAVCLGRSRLRNFFSSWLKIFKFQLRFWFMVSLPLKTSASKLLQLYQNEAVTKERDLFPFWAWRTQTFTTQFIWRPLPWKRHYLPMTQIWWLNFCVLVTLTPLEDGALLPRWKTSWVSRPANFTRSFLFDEATHTTQPSWFGHRFLWTMSLDRVLYNPQERRRLLKNKNSWQSCKLEKWDYNY